MQISAVDTSLNMLAAIYCQYGRVIVFFATITMIDGARAVQSPLWLQPTPPWKSACRCAVESVRGDMHTEGK